MFQNAKWIWKKGEIVNNDYAYFKKVIEVNQKISSGEIFLSAHNHFKLYINGQRVSNFVTPASSVADKRKLYLSYNIKNYLKVGKNVIVVKVLFLGGNGQNYVDFYPGLIASGHVNGNIKFNTDLSWRSISQIPYKTQMPFQQNRRITPVECYDSRLSDKAIFISPDDNNLDEVVYSKIEKSRPILSPQLVPEGHFHDVIIPISISSNSKVSVFDAGRIVTGFVRFKLKGKKDVKITVRYSEDLVDGRVGRNVANESSDNYCDYYIMNGDDLETHQADFTYKAFRYFEIEGYGKEIDSLDIEVFHTSTAIAVLGNLSSQSFPLLNRLFESSVNTYLNNTQGMLTDCPHREQAQYLGDSDLQAEVLAYNFSNSVALLDKVLTDFTDALLPEGCFPFVSPGNYYNTEFEIRISEYDLYYFTILEKLFHLTNDLTYVKKYYPTAKQVLNYYLNQIDKTNLILKEEGWHISDWPYPTVNDNGKYLTVQNLLMVKVLKIMIKFGTLLNLDVSRYEKILNDLILAIRTHLLKDGLLEDSYQTNSFHQGVNALGLDVGIFTKEETTKVLDFIVQCGFSSSVILGRTVLRVLFENNRAEEAFKIMFDYDKGWGNILNQGWKTMWEGFSDIESHSHAWNTYPVRMIQEYLAGVKFNPDNNLEVIIEPQFVSRVKDLQVSVVTAKGVLKFAYEIINDKVRFNYSIPKGIKATLVFAGKTTIIS